MVINKLQSIRLKQMIVLFIFHNFVHCCGIDFGQKMIDYFNLFGELNVYEFIVTHQAQDNDVFKINDEWLELSFPRI